MTLNIYELNNFIIILNIYYDIYFLSIFMQKSFTILYVYMENLTTYVTVILG